MAGSDNARIGILASGGGTTFEFGVHDAIQTGRISGVEIGVVICNNGPNNPDAQVWERANRLGVDIVHISNLTQDTCTVPTVKGEPVKGTISFEASEAMLALAKNRGLDLMVGLGFMKRIVGPALQELSFANEHPGPLGPNLLTAGKWADGVQEKVMELGLAYSGPTMHWMDKRVDKNGLPTYDTGPEIGHEPVEVTDDMLAEWMATKKVKLLKEAVMQVEKEKVPLWIVKALGELNGNS